MHRPKTTLRLSPFKFPWDSIQFAMSQFDEQGDNIGYSGVQFTLVFSNGLLPAIPEPSTWAMLLIGFAGIGFVAYRRKAKLALMAA